MAVFGAEHQFLAIAFAAIRANLRDRPASEEATTGLSPVQERQLAVAALTLLFTERIFNATTSADKNRSDTHSVAVFLTRSDERRTIGWAVEARIVENLAALGTK